MVGARAVQKLLNVAALEFVARLDEIGFEMALKEFLGEYLLLESERISRVTYRESTRPWKKL